MDINYDNDCWKVIDSYFRDNSNYLTKHHIESYNDFISNKIPITINQYNPQILYKELNTETKEYKYEIQLYYGGKSGDKIYIGKPVIFKDNDEEQFKKQMYPNEARLRNLTYASNIFLDIEADFIIKNSDEPKVISKTYDKINIGKIPIMIQSKICALNNLTNDLRKQMGECPYDQGGYFIVDGQEKVIVSHERKAENKLYIVKSNEDIYSYSSQIKSIPFDSFKYARTTIVNINKKTHVFTVRLPSVKSQIPLFILFRALGVESDKEILEYICYDLNTDKSKLFIEFLRPTMKMLDQYIIKMMLKII